MMGDCRSVGLFVSVSADALERRKMRATAGFRCRAIRMGRYLFKNVLTKVA